MRFFLNNMSEGWNDRLMEVLIRARTGDVIVVPNKDIARDARIFAWAANVVGGIEVVTREEYEAKHNGKGGEYEQRVLRPEYKPDTFKAE